MNEGLHAREKQAIAREAVALCQDGEPIIMQCGTTTLSDVHLSPKSPDAVFTNSFPIAEHLLKHSKNTVMLRAGTIYREQNIILSPFENERDAQLLCAAHVHGGAGAGASRVMEADPLLIQAEQKLIDQADDLSCSSIPRNFTGARVSFCASQAHRHRHYRFRVSRTDMPRC